MLVTSLQCWNKEPRRRDRRADRYPTEAPTFVGVACGFSELGDVELVESDLGLGVEQVSFGSS